jgi:hypothetical protein
MTPRKPCENTESIAVEVKDTHTLPEAEKTISHDPLLANAADTQQLGKLIPMYTDINIAYHPQNKKIAAGT